MSVTVETVNGDITVGIPALSTTVKASIQVTVKNTAGALLSVNYLTPEEAYELIAALDEAVNPPEPTPMEKWEALEIGDEFTIAGPTNFGDARRIKVSNADYVVLGSGELNEADPIFSDGDYPVKVEK
jgi:hypothetical protein